jgi:hypothetical protein
VDLERDPLSLVSTIEELLGVKSRGSGVESREYGRRGYCVRLFCVYPRVEAGMNTSTVIPASRKRRRKGNPVVSDETVMHGYESSATPATDRLHYKLQTRPLVRESPRGGG